MPTSKQSKDDFRNLFESEVMETFDCENEDDLLWYWETWIEAQVEDGTLPKRALSWVCPQWLAELNLQYLAKKAKL